MTTLKLRYGHQYLLQCLLAFLLFPKYNVSKTVIGTTINLTATTVNTLFGSNNFLQATLTVVGRDSGARLTIPVTITKTSAN